MVAASKPRKPGKAPQGNGWAYEDDGPEAQKIDMGEMRRALIWYPASPFMVSALKKIIRELYKVYGCNGSPLLESLDIRTVKDLDTLNDMSAVSVADLLEAAINDARDIGTDVPTLQSWWVA